jgi:hypothetical protein
LLLDLTITQEAAQQEPTAIEGERRSFLICIAALLMLTMPLDARATILQQPQDDALPRPSEEPSSRQREWMSLLRTTDAHPRPPFRKRPTTRSEESRREHFHYRNHKKHSELNPIDAQRAPANGTSAFTQAGDGKPAPHGQEPDGDENDRKQDTLRPLGRAIGLY